MSGTPHLAPPFTLARAASLWLQGRVRFPRDRIGEILKDGDDFIAFRHAIVVPSETQPSKPQAMLRIRFLFASASVETNRRLSLIPIPFIIGMPGFRSKLWALGQETGAFQGIYEWDTIEAAQAYMTSFAIRLMKMRARRESLLYEITGI